MRIEKLTTATAARLLRVRRQSHPAAQSTAERICRDVARRGDAAVLAWARRLDGARVQQMADVRITAEEMQHAAARCAPSLLRALRRAMRNIATVARRQLPRPWTIATEPGIRMAQIIRPLDTVACYIPGGRFALISTLLMTAIPAQVAGVRRILVACPRPNDALLAAAHLLGITDLLRIGGAQAIAAFAYGTPTIARADLICGPGNRFVTAAKRHVAARTAIDMPAGPTELLVLADGGNPRFIAADLLAQAEHDADAVVMLVTTSPALARAVRDEVARGLALLPTGNPARRSFPRNGAILVTPNAALALAFANRWAPEHLMLCGPVFERALDRVTSAGSIFLGPASAQTLGDYVTGTNHVLPTGGGAAIRGGLSARDFVKCVTVQRVSRAGLRRLAPAAVALARAEGLLAHERAVTVRMTARAKGLS
jgi:histidinol dehydrogenase